MTEGSHVLLKAKLRPPAGHASWVERHGLLQKLAGSRARLVLIAAPAGYGKTVLAAQWHASPAEGRPFAWVSLDSGDNDAGRLWSHITWALQRVSPGQNLVNTLGASPGPAGPAGAFLPALVNELNRAPVPRILLLDGYDGITEACQEQIAFLLAHAHRFFQLAVTTRAEPPLPPHRIRAAGEVTEIGTADLRLTPAQAQAVVHDVAKVRLRERDLASLLDRTEGWPTGVYLSALSLRGHPAGGALARPPSGDRHIADFLIEEVLTAQPGPTRQFLERTAILDRFTAPLCDAVAESGNADKIIDGLERDNIFLVPLDDERRWFRYHRLFREVLLGQLTRQDPALVPVLHARASVWHQQSGSPEQAIGHALAAADPARTVDLIAAHWRAYAAAGRTTDVAEWLNRIGQEQIAASPVAVHCAAWLAALSGQHSSARRWLALLDTSQHNRPLPDGAVCVEFSAALLRGMFAYGGLQAALESAAKAARLIADPASAWHATAQAVYGWNLYQAGLPELARTVLRDALAADADAPFARILALTAMSLMAADDGLTAQAGTLARQASRQLTEGGPRRAPEAALAHLALGCVLASQAQAADARRELELSLRIHAQCRWPSPWMAVEGKLRMAQVFLDLGDHDTATGMLDDIGDVLRALPDGTKALQARLARLQQRRAGTACIPAAREPFSARELAVLRLLRGSLSRREIGAQLQLSVNTIKTYTRMIYRKLGVSTREDAIARASDLGIFSRRAA